MKLLLDNCMPRPVERLLPGHEAIHTSRLGWGRLENGTLLQAAEDAGFQAMITVDRNIAFQQSMKGRTVSVVVIKSASNDIPTLESYADAVLAELAGLKPGSIVTVENP